MVFKLSLHTSWQLKLVCCSLSTRLALLFKTAQFDTANLPGDGLREFGELDPTDPFVGSEPRVKESKDRIGCLFGGRHAWLQHHESFRHGEPQSIRTRHHGRFSDAGMLE